MRQATGLTGSAARAPSLRAHVQSRGGTRTARCRCPPHSSRGCWCRRRSVPQLLQTLSRLETHRFPFLSSRSLPHPDHLPAWALTPNIPVLYCPKARHQTTGDSPYVPEPLNLLLKPADPKAAHPASMVPSWGPFLQKGGLPTAAVSLSASWLKAGLPPGGPGWRVLLSPGSCG